MDDGETRELLLSEECRMRPPIEVEKDATMAKEALGE